MVCSATLERVYGFEASGTNVSGSSILEVIDSVRRVTGREVPVRLEDRRPGDPAVAVASNAKARELLGWVPGKSKLDDIVADAWSAHH